MFWKKLAWFLMAVAWIFVAFLISEAWCDIYNTGWDQI